MTEYVATDRELLDALLALDEGLTEWEVEFIDKLDKQLLRGLSLSARQRNSVDDIVRERT